MGEATDCGRMPDGDSHEEGNKPRLCMQLKNDQVIASALRFFAVGLSAKCHFCSMFFCHSTFAQPVLTVP